MSGGGSAPAQPSTTTQINDIPEWEQGYVKDLLGQAQTIAAQPYQQFNGPQVAGFTPDQMQAFQNIEGSSGANQVNQSAATGQVMQGANTANNIYGAGSGAINASTGYNPLAAVSPFLGAATGYNSAAAAQPWLNQAAGYEGMAANAGTPQGIQSYMSPYTDSVVKGLQDQANQNWNQNIMPGINDKFVGSGQYGSGRNAQVLGQAAGNFQTGLSANVANALQQGYNTAGTQAANQANLLAGLGGQSLTGANTASGAQNAQVENLLNEAQAAGTATQQQAGNLQNAGTALGNLAATQGSQQIAAGTQLGNLGEQQAKTNLNQDTALQAVGQQQQQLEQANLNTAMQNFQNQVNYPAQQTEYLNQIIHGLPAPTSSTSSTQATPAYSVSPLSGIGGSLAAATGLLAGKKEGGLIKGYATGGAVDGENIDDEDMVPLDYLNSDNESAAPVSITDIYGNEADGAQQYADNGGDPSGNNTPLDAIPAKQQVMAKNPIEKLDTPASKVNSVNPLATQEVGNAPTQGEMQQQQLLALARGMLTPSLGGSTAAAFGQGLGNVQELQSEQRKQQIAQQNTNFERNLQKRKLDIMENRGVGANDTIARRLMQDNPDLTYEEALQQAFRKNVGGDRGTSAVSASPSKPSNNVIKSIPSHTDLVGEDYLKTLNPGDASIIKAIGDGHTKLSSIISRMKPDEKKKIVSGVMQYNPNYSDNDLGGFKSFNTGTQGNQVRAFNTAIEHTASTEPLIDALQNGDMQLANKIGNKLSVYTGGTPVTSFDAAKTFLSGEVAKAIVGGQNAQADREHYQQLINESQSPQQLKTNIGIFKEFMAGQLKSLDKQYQASTGHNDFEDRLLLPKAKAEYAKHKDKKEDSPSGDKMDFSHLWSK